MDSFLQRVASQTMTFAIRSGIGVVSGFALKKGQDYIRTLRGTERQELMDAYARLDSKIRIIAPAIDLVELVAARGNTTLESAITLTKSLRADLQNLGVRFQNALNKNSKHHHFRSEPKVLIRDVQEMIRRLEDAVPLINLALNTSGVDLSTSLPDSISPSRLLQASMFITQGDHMYQTTNSPKAQIGMNFTLSLYMLFAGHAHRKESISASDLTWQEVIRKCRLRLERVPLRKYLYGENPTDEEEANTMGDENRNKEYCYDLVIIEDLDDGLAHDEEELAQNGMGGPFEGVERAGIRTRIPIHQIGKLFYTNSGKLLGIDESSAPVLLLSRQKGAVPPRKLEDYAHQYEWFEHEEDDNEEADETSISIKVKEQPKKKDEPHDHTDLPRSLDQEWLAFGIYQEDRSSFDAAESDPEDELDDEASNGTLLSSSPPDVSSLSIHGSQNRSQETSASPFDDPNLKSHLSLLEYLVRLLSLQTSMQMSHLGVPDEMLNLFLTNASGNLNTTYRSRADERDSARRKLGFDPFAPSPKSRNSSRQEPDSAASTPGLPRQQTPLQNTRTPGLLTPAPARHRRSPLRRSAYADDEWDEDESLPAMQSSPIPVTSSRAGMPHRDSAFGSMPMTPDGRKPDWSPEGRR